MSQKNFTSHGHPIPGAPYRPDQQPRNVARCGGPGLCPDCSREAQAALTAAAPHLRAAWGQPIRELCEAAIKRANDPLAARGFYGEAFPATVYAQDILDLLEGGGEDK